jgi:hypothetical protein
MNYRTTAPFNNFFFMAKVQPEGMMPVPYPGANPQNCPADRILTVIPGTPPFRHTIQQGLGNLVNVVDPVTGFNGYIPSTNPIFAPI